MDENKNENKNNDKLILPMIPLRGLVIFPDNALHFDIGRYKSLLALDKAVENNTDIFLVSQKDGDSANPTPRNINKIGVIAKIKQVLKLPGDNVRLSVGATERAKIIEYVSSDDAFEVSLEKLEPKNSDTLKTEALLRKNKELLSEYRKTAAKIAPELYEPLLRCAVADKFVDMLAQLIVFKEGEKQSILEENDTEKRLILLFDILNGELEISRLEKKISARARRAIDKNQREYYLREQMKVIHEELGDDEEETAELEKKIKAAKMPELTEQKALKELRRMGKMTSSSPDVAVIRTYIEWLTDIPWTAKTKDNKDLNKARQILDDDHYGLDKIKRRILEYLAVVQLTDGLNGPILCFVGPPGVGKTSIAKSIASCLNRKFVRMSLGGIRDEAEIRGHRRTYIGSIPGKIIYQMKQAGVLNPVFLLDEVDKMASDYRGDPAAALLEVLDPEQNNTFDDHYLEVPYDLSNVMFVTTANSTDSIPAPLIDRMEIIELSGYTDEEKQAIGKSFLLPKQEKMHGIKKGIIEITDAALINIISLYTKESGVRGLERQLAKICRRIAKRLVDDKSLASIKITPDNLEEYLETPKYKIDLMSETDVVGSAAGLAWTAVGGTTLTVDVTLMKGKGEIQLTGQLGDIMKESARTAISLIRSMAEDFGINPKIFRDTDIHIHVPEGAIPKDGPSAGITMATAILSAFTDKPVNKNVAMTGEITLRGRVLPIGGLKEKSLAAYRAGYTTIIIPKENEKDIAEIPKTVRDKLNIVLSDNIKSVFDNALC